MDNLFNIEKISIGDCQDLTIQSLKAYAYGHRHWVIAWSGGKDSTATMTLIIYLILSGQIERPETLTVMYADTRLELPPLAISAMSMLKHLDDLNLPWLKTKIVTADIDHRFMVYMLGRPQIDIINSKELERIHWHWENNIWPQKWEGTEPLATIPFEQIFSDGYIQKILF